MRRKDPRVDLEEKIAALHTETRAWSRLTGVIGIQMCAMLDAIDGVAEAGSESDRKAE